MIGNKMQKINDNIGNKELKSSRQGAMPFRLRD